MSLKILNYMFSSGAAGLLSMSLCYPFDTVRRSLMVNGSEGYQKKFGGTLQCFKIIFKEGGVFGFYKGWFPFMLKILPNIAL